MRRRARQGRQGVLAELAQASLRRRKRGTRLPVVYRCSLYVCVSCTEHAMRYISSFCFSEQINVFRCSPANRPLVVESFGLQSGRVG